MHNRKKGSLPGMDLGPFNCPDCSGAISRAGETLRCAGCGSVFPIEDGIPNFCREEVYWGEFDPATSQRLLDRCGEAGWRAAIGEVLGHRPDMIAYCTDPRRANPLHLVPPDRRQALLDIGTGWGILASVASTLFETVHTIEAVPVRVKFAARRFEQEGRGNITTARASILAPPFARSTFDVVLMNGVLEWIGDWNRSIPPEAAQEKTLRTILGLLKPGGILIVGIENRWGYNFFLGRRDHNGLWGTNLLPRFAAEAVSRLRGKGSYRAYTHSLPALRRLLERSGYCDLECFAPHPAYNRPHHLLSLDTPEPLRFYLRNHASRHTGMRRIAARGALALASMGWLKHVMPDFCVFARKREQ